MNFIAAIVLVQMAMHETDAFCVMVSLFTKHKYNEIFEFSPGGNFR
jgi:hypothetical protein